MIHVQLRTSSTMNVCCEKANEFRCGPRIDLRRGGILNKILANWQGNVFY